MKQTKNGHGDNAFMIPIRILVTATVFATALSEERFNADTIDFKTLKRSEGMRILKDRLFFHGIYGSYQGLDDIGDNQDVLNAFYTEALKWVYANYPYLKTAK